MSAQCAICGDTLLTQPISIEDDNHCLEAKEYLRQLFAGHLSRKHPVPHETTANH